MSAAGTATNLAALVERRAAGEPLEHILGWTEFCGLRMTVTPGVFVPRRRTEFLVRQAAALGRPAPQPPVDVVDLCCGSGAVCVALVEALGEVELNAVDIDPAAVASSSKRRRLQCARRNVTPAGGQVYQGDLYEPLPAALQGHVDLLVVNAPYVRAGRSNSCRRRPACTSRAPRSTVARTGSMSNGEWSTQRRHGWHRGVAC
jgi:release factor glutamine methyltransferase